MWLYEDGFDTLIYPVEKVCDDTGEDPDCSRYVFPCIGFILTFMKRELHMLSVDLLKSSRFYCSLIVMSSCLHMDHLH